MHYLCPYNSIEIVMKNKLIFLVAATMWLVTSCTQHNKCVENPFIESANTMTLDITKVELNDTATVLHMDAYYRPHYWIKISSESYLLADGKKYALTATQDIEADSLFLMPDSGEASFRLTFEPLPHNTRSFDFIESDCDECFKLFGVDLTGKKHFSRPAGLPADAIRSTENIPDTLPAPLFTVGETVLRMHFPGYRKELVHEAEVYVTDLLNGQQPYTAPIDPETGTAELKFWQYGTAQAFIATDMATGTVWLAPGEAIDLYIDMRQNGVKLLKRRHQKKGTPDIENFQSVYATGTYACLLSPALYTDQLPEMNLDILELADYELTADEYTRKIIDVYHSLSDSIAQSTLPKAGKELVSNTLKQNVIVAMAQGDFFRTYNYRQRHNQWDRNKPLDIQIDPLTTENRAEVCKLFPIADPKLLLGNYLFYAAEFVNSYDIWPKEAGLEGTFISDLKTALPLVKKANNALLTEDDLKALAGLQNPTFYREALQRMQENAQAALKASEGKAIIEKTPETTKEKLFDAIIAPYKGKVILVDFWNTWCGPCRMSIKANEPLKEDELKSDELVWIYIANETSPIVEYKKMIPDIRGKHFRLNAEQWGYLCEQFKIDGIPSYVLVDKTGRYELRNDFRNHDQLKSTLKGMIE